MMPRPLLNLAALAALIVPMATATAQTAPLATVTVEAAGTTARQASVDGVVEAVRQTTLSTQVPGAIVALNVKAGDRVRAGQELLRIDARAAQQGVAASASQVQAAQAALDVASKDYERQRALLQKQYISQAALDRALAQRDAAQAQVQALQAQNRAAQAQSGFFVLHAPYAGIVSDVPVTLGDMTMPGRPLITLHDPAALRVTASVPQSMLLTVQVDPRSARFEIPGVPALKGPQTPTQVQVLPTVDAATHTAEIRLALPTGVGGVAPGMFARVWLPGAEAGAPAGDGPVTVPASAVLRRGEVTGVYVLGEDGKPRLRQVRLGRSHGDRVEVLSGLRQGARIVADPQAAAAAR
jgi:membrane fusion protein, multidrug efflux system